MKKNKKYNPIKAIKRAARMIIGHPSKGKKIGAHLDHSKEEDKYKCRTSYEDEIEDCSCELNEKDEK